MKQKTTFYFLSSDEKDNRRISVEVEDYPVNPANGEEVKIPVFQKHSRNKYIYGVVTKVIHDPMSCYFDDGAHVECLVRLYETDMDEAYLFLVDWQMKHDGRLTHQWANWRTFEAFGL